MSTWQAVLTWITIVVAVVTVVLLAATLIVTWVSLRRSRRLAETLAGGLETVVTNTDSLTEQLPTINGALGQLLAGLLSVDRHLGGAARAFGLRRE